MIIATHAAPSGHRQRGLSWQHAGFQAAPASAQLFWDWGGGNIGRRQRPRGRALQPAVSQGPDHRQLRRPPPLLSSPSRARRSAIRSPFRASRAAGRA